MKKLLSSTLSCALTYMHLLFFFQTVGNAAFHSGELYPQLRASIAPLTRALQDDDEKTRANAAGAIGNLIRNGPELSSAMAEHRVVERLLFILMNDADPAPKVRVGLVFLMCLCLHKFLLFIYYFSFLCDACTTTRGND